MQMALEGSSLLESAKFEKQGFKLSLDFKRQKNQRQIKKVKRTNKKNKDSC